MVNLIGKLRSAITAGLIVAAQKAAPDEAKQAIGFIHPLLKGINEEWAKGRTGGVVTAVWSIDKKGQEIGEDLHRVAHFAMDLRRRELEG